MNHLITKLLLLSTLSISTCKSSEESDPKYVTIQQQTGFSGSQFFAIAKANRPFKIDVIGHEYIGLSDKIKVRDYAIQSIRAWMDPLQMFYSNINNQVSISFTPRSDADYTVNVHGLPPNYVKPANCNANETPESHSAQCRRSYALVESRMIEFFLENISQRDAGVLTHEFGHAFGLGDTYLQRFQNLNPGYSIMSGTIMLRTIFSSDRQQAEISYDDLFGLQYLYCKKFSDECDQSFFVFSDVNHFKKLTRHQIFFMEMLRKLYVYILQSSTNYVEFYDLYRADLDKVLQYNQSNPQYGSNDPLVKLFLRVGALQRAQLDVFGQCIRSTHHFNIKTCLP